MSARELQNMALQQVCETIEVYFDQPPHDKAFIEKCHSVGTFPMLNITMSVWQIAPRSMIGNGGVYLFPTILMKADDEVVSISSGLAPWWDKYDPTESDVEGLPATISLENLKRVREDDVEDLLRYLRIERIFNTFDQVDKYPLHGLTRNELEVGGKIHADLKTISFHGELFRPVPEGELGRILSGAELAEGAE